MPKDWLDEVLEGTSELESPKAYYYWSALCALSAVCKRNVYLNQFSFYLYPNIYVFLVGKSGIRKGPPVSLAARLVEGVRNTRVIKGRGSIQSIVKILGTAVTQENGPLLDEASGFIAAGEFASSLVDDDAALDILTDLYDAHYHTSWKNTLIGREGETLDRPYVVLLGASNQAHLKDKIFEKDIQGGFIARTFIISATSKNTKNSLVRAPTKIINEGKLIDYLKHVSTLRGEFVWKDSADKLYDDWYNSFDDEREDVTGTRARIHTSVLKVAMLLSLTKRDTLELFPEDINDSLIACNDLISSMNQVFMPGKGGETEIGKKISMVLTDLLNAQGNKISRQQLMTRHWGFLDAMSLDTVIETLVQPGMIKVQSNGTKASHTFYQLTSEGLEALLEMEGRIKREQEVKSEEEC